MKKVLILALLTLVFSQINAQEIQALDTLYVINCDKDYGDALSLNNDSSFFGFKWRHNGLAMGVTNESTFFISQTIWDLTYRGIKHKFYKVLIIKNQPYILTTTTTVENKNTYHKLYFSKFNINEKFLESPTLVLESEQLDERFNYKVQVSDNKKYALVLANMGRDKKKISKFKFTVLNQNLNILFDGSEEWQNKGSYSTDVAEIMVTNKGEAALLILSHNTETHLQNNKEYILHVYSNDSDDFFEKNVFVPQMNITNYSKFITHENGDIELFCWYAKGQQAAIGLLIIKFEAITHHLISQKTEPCTFEMVSINMDKERERQKVKNKITQGKSVTMPYLFHMADILLYRNIDGSILLVSDRNYGEVAFDGAVPRYFGKGICIYKFDIKRNFEWGAYVDRHQFTLEQSDIGFDVYQLPNGDIGFSYIEGDERKTVLALVNNNGILASKYVIINERRGYNYAAQSIKDGTIIYGNSMDELFEQMME